MKKILTILFLFLGLSTFAQQGLQMELPEIDSTELEQHRQLEYYQLIHGNFSPQLSGEQNLLPEFDLMEEYHKRYTLNLQVTALPQYVFTSINTGFLNSGFSPYYTNAQVLSQAAYKLGDKLTIGGFSYGANSLHTAPLPKNNSSYFDTYGSTMFMEYKVSKNFKIETRVSVGTRQGPPGFLP